MLAEELMRIALGEATSGPPSLASLEGARVLARLVSLQRDADYRAVAVTRDDSDYQRVAESWLGGVDVDAALPLPLAAVYALAVDDWSGLRDTINSSKNREIADFRVQISE